MVYADEDNGAAGSIPDCGAIFMANAVTKKECLRHNVFALPSSMTGFVKHVKAGMALFMFEYGKRELFGVYQAISDGAMDIVPHAFHRVGKHFPAQVIFRQIWNCYPLSENEFRDAIRENYFSAKKFNFGLSEDQVHRLLLLFSAKKQKNKPPACPETELVLQSYGQDRHLANDMFLLNKETYMEPKGGFHPSLLRDHEDNSFKRAKNGEFSLNRVHKEGKINSDDQGLMVYPDDFFTKRRRLDNNGRPVLNKVAEAGLYNRRSSSRFKCIDSQKDSLNEEGRLGDNCRGLNVDWVSSDSQVGKDLNPVLSTECVLHPRDVRMTDCGNLMHKNRMFREFNRDISFGEAFETERFGKPLNRSKLSIDDDKFLINDCIQTEYSASNAVTQSDQDLAAQAGQVTNDHQCSTNMNFEDRYHVRHDGSLSASANPCNLLYKVRKTTAGGNLPINERTKSEPNFGTCSGAGSENFANPLHSELRAIHNGKISIIDRKATESTLSPAALKNSRYIANCGGQVDDDMFRNRNRLKNLEDIDKYASPVISSEHPSLIRVPESHDSSYSTFDHDDVSKISFIDHGCSSALGADRNSILVREDLPYHGSLDPCHLLCTDFSLPYFFESKISSRCLQVPFETMNMLAGKNSLFPEENYYGVHVYRAESDLKTDDGHFLKMSHNMNLKEHQEHSEAPHLSSNIRKSVFTRLTSGRYVQFDVERNEDHFNSQDCYMDASADEVMEMLHGGKNLPCSKLKNIRIFGQHNHGETSLDGKQTKSHVNVNQLMIEKKKLKDAYLATVEGSNKVPEETRVVDFKRRSETKKTLVETGTTSVAIKNIIDDSGEDESSAKKTYKRKRLVRPVFRENELAVDNLVSEENTRFPGQFLDKDDGLHFESAICTSDAQIPNDDSRSTNVLSLGSQQSMNTTTKENTSRLPQKGPCDNILSSTHHGPKRHATLHVDLENGSSQVFRKDTSQYRISCIQTPKISVLSTDDDTVSSLNLPKSSADRV